MNIIHVVSTCILIVLAPAISSATLGESVAPSGKNVSNVRASQKVGAEEKYSTYEYEQNGNTVKEFASPSGIVFAVSWQGVSKPDLDALFGSYYTEYKDAFKQVPKNYGMKSVSLKTSKMVIRRGGRMRDQRGFIYVPALVPPGVNVEELP